VNDTAPAKLRDPDLLKAGAALQRAARKAQELAQKTATPCYVWQSGKIVNIGTAVVVAPAPVD
jgi:hypothetical protein